MIDIVVHLVVAAGFYRLASAFEFGWFLTVVLLLIGFMYVAPRLSAVTIAGVKHALGHD